jgi:tRNA(adenine34) deaminase
MIDSEAIEAALVEARHAAEAGEVPIGAVIVYEDEILTRGQNRVLRDNDPTAHAEIVALREATGQLPAQRLHSLRDARAMRHVRRSNDSRTTR